MMKVSQPVRQYNQSGNTTKHLVQQVPHITQTAPPSHLCRLCTTLIITVINDNHLPLVIIHNGKVNDVMPSSSGSWGRKGSWGRCRNRKGSWDSCNGWDSR
jgi:hypothetical protein